MDLEGQVIESSRATSYADDHQGAHELTQLADELVDQIATARRHYADLRAAIDGSATVAVSQPAREQVPEPEEESEPGYEQGYHRTPEEEAEIVALGMALNGGSRDEAHTHIVETFGIYDTDEILDRTFGAAAQAPPDEPKRRRRFGRPRRG